MRTQIQNRIANFKETADAFRGEKTEWHKHQVSLLEAKVEQLEWALKLIPEENGFTKEDVINALHKAELKHNKDYSGIWTIMETHLKK